MKILSPPLRASVRILRIAAPINAAVCMVVGAFAIKHHLPIVEAVDFFCAGVSVMLANVEWFFFEL